MFYTSCYLINTFNWQRWVGTPQTEQSECNNKPPVWETSFASTYSIFTACKEVEFLLILPYLFSVLAKSKIYFLSTIIGKNDACGISSLNNMKGTTTAKYWLRHPHFSSQSKASVTALSRFEWGSPAQLRIAEVIYSISYTTPVLS